MKKEDLKNLSLEEKKKLLKKKLMEKKKVEAKKDVIKEDDFRKYTFDMFEEGNSPDDTEIKRFNQWAEKAEKAGIYAFESARLHEQKENIDLKRETGETLSMINFSSYNYLGYAYHPEVKQASVEAVNRYGTGAASSPVISGTFALHKEVENELVRFMGFDSEKYGVSLFSSGYGVNTGTISAYMKPGSCVILDELSHASLMEGAVLSGSSIRTFKHNDMEDLEKVLRSLRGEKVRKLICCEGVYSADGDRGKVKDIVKLAKRYNARTLIDEAHSIMVAGENGRGVCEEQGVLNDIDFFVITFSKSLASVGGALITRKEYARYINWYARVRMFSAAIPPGVAGSVKKALELGSGENGRMRRKKLHENAFYMREKLSEKINILDSDSWIIPAMCYDEKKSLELNDYLQRKGLDGSIMNYPAVPRGESRIRLFVTSEHTWEHIDKAVKILFDAGEKFGFLKK